MILPDRLVLATGNAGKRAEWAALLAPLGVAIEPVDLPEVDEPSGSVVENARLKAVAAVAHTGLPALGDDIGLEIAALNGRPGAELKRWAFGEHGSWAGARAYCATLAGSEARYSCGLALALPNGTVFTALGTTTGTLADASGDGPGVEPCFRPAGAPDALSELPAAERSRLHYRDRALRTLLAG